MSQSPLDTIVAPITGNQPAAVAVIRLSGPDSWQIANAIFSNWKPESHHARFGTFATGDTGLVLPFAPGRSYTGEEAVELSTHGSIASVKALVESCLSNGARMAEPGEFTLRAFLNGRLDLSQAEAVADTVNAKTDAQLRLANLHRGGALKDEIEQIRSEILLQLVAVEASVDFSEEIGGFDRASGLQRLDELTRRLSLLAKTADSGRILRSGLRIAIVGPPNAGKSSLLNRLLGAERSIVTAIPGTTRDYIEESVDFGIPCILIDTAGLRESTDIAESVGVQRSRAQAASADEIWYVYDASVGFTTEDQEAVSSFEPLTTIIANKCDLASSEPGIQVSATTGKGIPNLIESVRSRVQDVGELPWVNDRQAPLIEEALQSLETARQAMANDIPDDLISVGLRSASQALGEITGETASPDIIHRIFHDFCIGK